MLSAPTATLLPLDPDTVGVARCLLDALTSEDLSEVIDTQVPVDEAAETQWREIWARYLADVGQHRTDHRRAAPERAFDERRLAQTLVTCALHGLEPPLAARRLWADQEGVVCPLKPTRSIAESDRRYAAAHRATARALMILGWGCASDGGNRNPPHHMDRERPRNEALWRRFWQDIVSDVIATLAAKCAAPMSGPQGALIHAHAAELLRALTVGLARVNADTCGVDPFERVHRPGWIDGVWMPQRLQQDTIRRLVDDSGAPVAAGRPMSAAGWARCRTIVAYVAAQPGPAPSWTAAWLAACDRHLLTPPIVPDPPSVQAHRPRLL